MKHLRFLPLLLIAACGDDLSSHDGVIEAQVDLMNDAADVIKTIKDKKSAEAAKSKLDALSKRGNEIEAAMSKLKGDPDPATAQKWMKKMTEATSNLMSAMQGLPDDPEVQRIVGEFNMGR